MKYIILSILFLYLFYKLAKWILLIALRISFQELAKYQARQQGDVIIQTNQKQKKSTQRPENLGEYVDYTEIK